MSNFIIFFWVLISLNLLIQSSAESKKNGLSFDVFHRDSKISPFYNHSMTPSEILEKAILDSHTQVNLFKPSMHINRKDFFSEVTRIEGSYLMNIHLGSPRVEISASMSTGSNIIWVQCKSCKKCFGEEEPLYKPNNSPTYRKIHFGTSFCNALRHKHVGDDGVCEFSYVYEDGTHTSGVLSSEEFEMVSTADERVPIRMAFGCSNLINGRTQRRGVQGMVGLGSGKLSFIFQLANYIEKKFSYCLLPSTAETTSKLMLGQEATISENGKISTPLKLDDDSRLYYIILDGVTVEGKNKHTPEDPVNIVIDSGSTLTFLHSRIYNHLIENVKGVIETEPVANPPPIFNLCYKNKVPSINFPEITFHFEGGDLHLKPENIFQKYKDMHCLMIDRNDEVSILGNFAQVNHKVEFDYDEMKVSFARADCADQS